MRGRTPKTPSNSSAACAIDRQQSIVEVGHQHERVGVLDDRREQRALRQRGLDAAFERLVQVAQRALAVNALGGFGARAEHAGHLAALVADR